MLSKRTSLAYWTIILFGKCFWGYVKSKSFQSSIPDSIYYKEATTNNPHDIADAFSRLFSECFNREEVDDSVITIIMF